MMLRWVLALFGGAWLAAVMGALAAFLTPGPALNGIALGPMVSALVWVLVALGVMSTQHLRSFILRAGAIGLAASLLCVWSVLS